MAFDHTYKKQKHDQYSITFTRGYEYRFLFK